MRERFLFLLTGLMIGFFVGFVFAGNISSRPALPAQQMPASVSNALDDARKQPNDFDSQVKAAELYYQIQRYDDALAYLLQANRIQPEHFETIVNLGTVSLEAGHTEDAEKWFKLALSRQPNNVSVWLGYCTVLLQRGNLKESAEALNKLETLDPTNTMLPQLRTQLQGMKSKR